MVEAEAEGQRTAKAGDEEESAERRLRVASERDDLRGREAMGRAAALGEEEEGERRAWELLNSRYLVLRGVCSPTIVSN